MKKLRDYCSGFPEHIEGIEIGQSCCKYHDNDVGMRGTYNPITPHTAFFKCLRKQGVSLAWSSIIAFGGAFFSWLKYPLFAYNIYKYRKQKKR